MKRNHLTRTTLPNQSAFTMIELVMVIVLLGILAALALPRLDRDIRQEAADNILSSIRYTRLMALTDDKIDPASSDWQKTLWSIRFYGGSNAYYRVGADKGKDGALAKEECAIDPYNGKYLFNSNGNFAARASDESESVFIGHRYGINSISGSGGCQGTQYIAFDQLGRPHVGIGSAGNDYATYMNQDCTFTFTFTDTSISALKITIEKQTGHAYIVGQPNS